MCVKFYVYEISSIGKSMETDSRLVAARAWEKKGLGTDHLEAASSFGVMKCPETRRC